MTFGEARDILRHDVLAEASTDYYEEPDLLAYLVRSAKEIALSFAFPTALGTTAIAANGNTFDLPADAEYLELNEVAFEGLPLALAPVRVILEYANQTSVGLPRYYNFEAKRGGTVMIAPRTVSGGIISFEYVQKYDVSSIDASTPVWGGLHPAFHELVVQTAAMKAFDASLEVERSAYWGQRASQTAAALALYLNKTPANIVVAPEVAES